MRAVCYAREGVVEVREVAKAVLEERGDAVVKVTHAGICGSDLHPLHGREKGLDVGTVMGHEFVGVVVAAGRDVKVMVPGTVVFTPFSTSCGRCFYCKRGLTCRCEHAQLFGWRNGGKGLHGGQAQFVRVPLADSTLRVLPRSVKPEEALLVGDILSTALHCAMNAGVGGSPMVGSNATRGLVVFPRVHAGGACVDGVCGVERPYSGGAASVGAGAGVGAGGSGGKVGVGAGTGRSTLAAARRVESQSSAVYVVVGCGPVGLLTVLCCRALGVSPKRLFAVDCVPARLAMAGRFGATPLNFKVDNVGGAVRAATQGRGADACMEAVGASSALKLAYDVVRPGGVLSSVGVHTDSVMPINGVHMYDKNLTLRMGRCPARDVMEVALDIVSTGEYRRELSSLITHHFGLEDAPKAYALFHEKRDGCIKVVLHPQGRHSKL